MSTISKLSEEHSALISLKKEKIKEITDRKFTLTWKNTLTSLILVLLLVLILLMELNVVLESILTNIFILAIVYPVQIFIISIYNYKVLLIDEECSKKMGLVSSITDKQNLHLTYSKQQKQLFRTTLLYILLSMVLIFVLIFAIELLKVSILGIQAGGCVLFLIILLYTTEEVFKEIERRLYIRKIKKQLTSIMSEMLKQF